MSKIYKGVSELIGKTPIIEAVNFEKAVEADATILQSLNISTRQEALRTELHLQ